MCTLPVVSAWGLDWDLDVQVPLIGGCATVRGEENADAVSSLGRPNVGLPGRGAAVCTALQNVVIRTVVCHDGYSHVTRAVPSSFRLELLICIIGRQNGSCMFWHPPFDRSAIPTYPSYISVLFQLLCCIRAVCFSLVPVQARCHSVSDPRPCGTVVLRQ
jgi:hypothetical protein